MPTWNGAEWIGEVWVDDIESVTAERQSTALPVLCRLEGAKGYARARLLVRTKDRTFGFVTIGVSDCSLDFVELECRLARLPRSERFPGWAQSGRDYERPATVVICTRDRPKLLRMALESVLAVDYPDFDVIVVDNASTTTETREYVLKLSHPRLTLIHEPQPGVSRARNTGLLAATGDVVAFVDDDVVVDRNWLRALMSGFTRAGSVSCVSGIVPPGEIRTPAQAYFDARVGWADYTHTRLYDLAVPPRDVPLFPFAVRCYGTGASFAVERDVVVRIGGFDTHLGPGTPTGGGEDLDLFFRILRSGRQLVHEPSAIAWHRHRADNEELLAQTRGYALGLGAWLSKIIADPETAWLAMKTACARAPHLARHLYAASKESAPSPGLAQLLPPKVGDETIKFAIKGARAYMSARQADRGDTDILGRTRHPCTLGAIAGGWDGAS